MQALGRCIRHKQDYGAIILMDERMLDRSNQSSLSECAHPCCTCLLQAELSPASPSSCCYELPE